MINDLPELFDKLNNAKNFKQHLDCKIRNILFNVAQDYEDVSESFQEKAGELTDKESLFSAVLVGQEKEYAEDARCIRAFLSGTKKVNDNNF